VASAVAPHFSVASGGLACVLGATLFVRVFPALVAFHVERDSASPTRDLPTGAEASAWARAAPLPRWCGRLPRELSLELSDDGRRNSPDECRGRNIPGHDGACGHDGARADLNAG
jgi:hypothetical protein